MALYYPGESEQYSKETEEGKFNLASWEVVNHILTHGKDVIHVVESVMPHMNIVDTEYQSWGDTPSLHWVVGDTSGNYKVLEVYKNRITAHNNEKIRVVTNSPDFPQHVAALSKYENLTGKNREAKNPEGTGSLGLPGDFSSISRFARAHFLVKNTPPQKDLESAVKTSFHILNNFDIPEGAVSTGAPDNSHTTQYTVVYDLRNFQYFLRTQEDPDIKVQRYADVEKAINQGVMISGEEQVKDYSGSGMREIGGEEKEREKPGTARKGYFWWILIIIIIALGAIGYYIWYRWREGKQPKITTDLRDSNSTE